MLSPRKWFPPACKMLPCWLLGEYFWGKPSAIPRLRQFVVLWQRSLLKRRRAWRRLLLDTCLVVGSQYMACVACESVSETINRTFHGSKTAMLEFTLVANLLFSVLLSMATVRTFSQLCLHWPLLSFANCALPISTCWLPYQLQLQSPKVLANKCDRCFS